MRLMSFMLTTDQVLDQSKTVTHRVGWLKVALVVRERDGDGQGRGPIGHV